MTTRDLPTLNAVLNGSAAVLLVLGRVAIKQRKVRRHRALMLAALAVSAAFLASYLAYHYAAGAVTRYQGQGAMRVLYFSILLTHTPLATLMAPFIAWALWLAYQKRFTAHARLTRIVWPVWMYVSATGVAIYFMLHVI